jgi:hypothetical protein
MALQPTRSRVCSGSQSLEASPRVALLVAEIAQLAEAPRQRQQIGVATGLLARRFAISAERAWTLAADKADDEDTGVANSELRIVKDQP